MQRSFGNLLIYLGSGSFFEFVGRRFESCRARQAKGAGVLAFRPPTRCSRESGSESWCRIVPSGAVSVETRSRVDGGVAVGLDGEFRLRPMKMPTATAIARRMIERGRMGALYSTEAPPCQPLRLDLRPVLLRHW